MNQIAQNASDAFCAVPLAVYACRPDRMRGRLHEEAESTIRTAFQRDRDRIIHCAAFRRLKHKTQVFVSHEGDHYRTRLTHTIEVAQVARTLARALYVNEDLAEAIALAHDLGHAPFSHMGEEFLARCMAPYGGFAHNDQSLRIVTFLERRYPRWDGLNLTWETLEGIIKHNGPVTGDLPFTLGRMHERVDFLLTTHAPLEAQIAAIADDIAYNNHDVEDGLRAGLFTLKDLEDVPLCGESLLQIRKDIPDIPESYLIHEAIRDMMGAMVRDVLVETQLRLSALDPRDPDHIRWAGQQMVCFSDDMREKVESLRRFLHARMYRHYTINRMWLKVDRMITDLFGAFFTTPGTLPPEWQARLPSSEGHDSPRARVVCDYIAGMTDRYAIREHERVFDLYGESHQEGGQLL